MTDDSQRTAPGQWPELILAELLCSRLCHDIISPVGAVSNGLELMAEFGEGKGGDAMSLVVSSSAQAVEKLNFFRVAYGQAGMRQTGLSFDDAAKLLKPIVSGPRVNLDWAMEHKPTSPETAPGAMKLTLNLGLLALEALPRGGTLKITVANQSDHFQLTVLAAAKEARLTDEFRAAIDGTCGLEDLTPRTAQGAFTRLLAERLGTKIAVAATDGNGDEAASGLSFAVELPTAD